MIATDAAGRILYWNDQAAFLYGWEAEDVIGKNVLDITPTRNSTDTATQIMEEMRAGNEWAGQFIVKHRELSVVSSPVAASNNRREQPRYTLEQASDALRAVETRSAIKALITPNPSLLS